LTDNAKPADRLPEEPGAGALDLEEIYRQYARRVGGWAARLGGPGLDPEDVTHEVFLKVRDLLPGFEGTDHLTSWLYRITANIVLDRRRKERRRRWRDKLFGEGVELRGPVQGSPVDELERKEATQLVYTVLDTMKEKYRTVLLLFEIEGMPGDEIAEVLDIKIEMVWVWLHRARAQFRERLKSKPLAARHAAWRRSTDV
jgi:RNA polymerase sigma-70 factor (ECF subfamily)